MFQVQNTEAINNIRAAARLSISEGFPQMLSPAIVPVLDMTPDFHKKSFVFSSSPTTTGATTIYTTPTGKKTYLTGVMLDIVKNVTCDVATGVISVTAVIDGTTTTIVAVPVLTLTAERSDSEITFANPIAIDPGTAVSLTGTFTAGAMARSAIIYGYDEYA